VKKSVRIPSDSTASIRWRNLLGQRYVYLYPGRSGTTMRAGDTIPRARTRSVVELGELFNRLGPIVKAIEPAKVNEFLRSFTAALDGNEQNLGQAIHDLSLVAQTLGDRDAAVGRLVTNLDAVTGAITDRDREIRTVLDNLTTLATTFNEHTDVLVAAGHDLDDFTNKLADLIAGNRPGIDQTITNVDSIVQVIANRLRELESAVTNLDDASLSLYNASRFGEWLNQVIPCGAVTPTPGVNQGLDTTCENGTHPAASGTPGSSSTALSGTGSSVSTLVRRAMGMPS
jgi:phospholipid/cholesterol/gamma-HCH transport system substrate-binding protein